MYYEALPLGLEINWDKTKIQESDFNTANSNPASVSVLGNPVELVESFTILDAELMHAEEVKSEILRRIEIARGCMKSLTKNIWRSSITQSVKIRQYNIYVLPVLLYGSEMWGVTVKSGKRLNAFYRSVVPSTYSANSLHRPRHQPGSSHPHRSASCHPDDHGQASEILRPHRPFGFR